jgi:hypothetical protein
MGLSAKVVDESMDTGLLCTNNKQSETLTFKSREQWFKELIENDGDRLQAKCRPFYYLLWLLTWRPVALFTILLAIYVDVIEYLIAMRYGIQDHLGFMVAGICCKVAAFFLYNSSVGTIWGHLGAQGPRNNPFLRNQLAAYTAYELADVGLLYAEVGTSRDLLRRSVFPSRRIIRRPPMSAVR